MPTEERRQLGSGSASRPSDCKLSSVSKKYMPGGGGPMPAGGGKTQTVRPGSSAAAYERKRQSAAVGQRQEGH